MDAKKKQLAIVLKVVRDINRELNGRGEIDAAQVAVVLIGKVENESHPINQTIAGKLREAGL